MKMSPHHGIGLNGCKDASEEPKQKKSIKSEKHSRTKVHQSPPAVTGAAEIKKGNQPATTKD